MPYFTVVRRFEFIIPRDAIWVVGYSNDVMTYIPSKRALLEGGYAMIYVRSSVHPSPWASDIEEALVRKIHQIFYEK